MWCRLRVWRRLKAVSLDNSYEIAVDACWNITVFLAVFGGWEEGGVSSWKRTKYSNPSPITNKKRFVVERSLGFGHKLDRWIAAEDFASAPHAALGSALFVNVEDGWAGATTKLVARLAARYDYGPARLVGRKHKVTLWVSTVAIGNGELTWPASTVERPPFGYPAQKQEIIDHVFYLKQLALTPNQ